MFRDREVWTVLVGLVAANALFVHAISAGWLPMRWYNLGRFALLGAVLGAVVFLFRGWRAPFGLLKPLTVWRIQPLWFLLALAWAPLLATITLLGKGFLLGTGLAAVEVWPENVFEYHTLRTVLIGALIGEIVWVGYAISRLHQYTTMLVASIIVGAFWAAWWMPMVLLDLGVVPGIPVAALFFRMIGIAIMCGFIYAHTKSGLAVLALQFSVNSTVLIFPVAPLSGGIPTYMCYSTLYLVCSLLLYVRFGPWPLWPGAAALRARPA